MTVQLNKNALAKVTPMMSYLDVRDAFDIIGVVFGHSLHILAREKFHFSMTKAYSKRMLLWFKEKSRENMYFRYRMYFRYLWN